MDLSVISSRLPADRSGRVAVAFRLMMGWIFLTSGLSKLEGGFSYGYASQYLSKAVPVQTPELVMSFPEILGVPGLLLVKLGTFVMEPLLSFFSGLPFIGQLVIITELFIGLSLVLGLLTRLGSVTGVFMMIMFYYGNADWGHGLLNADIVYMAVFISLIVLDAGRTLSLDSYISEKIETDNRILKAFLGV
ncbi:MAG: DoxX family protein, partial [Candidatus Nanohaloarchaea archaeon]